MWACVPERVLPGMVELGVEVEVEAEAEVEVEVEVEEGIISPLSPL